MTTETKTAKTVYTDEVVEKMVDAYTAAESDEARASVVTEFADELGVKVQSVRAKLVNLQVYKAKVRTSKDGSDVETKDKIVGDIAKILGVEEERIESLTKATKTVLKMLRGVLQEAQEAKNSTAG